MAKKKELEQMELFGAEIDLGMSEREEWKEYLVSDLGGIITGKTPRTANPEYYGGSIPFLTPSDDMSFKYVYSTIKTITEIGKNSVKGSIIPKNSVCVSCIGSDLGKVIITTEETVTNQQINSIVVNTQKFDVDYVYYRMIILGKMLNYYSKTSTAVPIVNKSTFSNYKILCPSLATQQKIARILSALDDKIELNNKINQNLEQQAVSYFDYLFITNAKSSWPEGTISDLGKVVGGSTPSKSKSEYYTDKGIAWITPKDLSINKSKFLSHGADDITELGLLNSSASIMPAGTVLFSSRAPIGYIAIADGEVTTNQGFKSVIPKSEVGTAFVYFFLKNALPMIESMASGSTFKEISGSAMRSVPAIIPDKDSLKAFSEFCEPLFQQQRVLEIENQHLSALRDALLPRLMSGELDVSNLEI